MNIRDMENILFEEWRKKYLHASFVIDGCPNPDVYKNENRKVVYVLKDGNLGNPDPSWTLNDRTYDQRNELENSPTLWWRTIALWSFFIKNNSSTWERAEELVFDKESIRESLSRHCVVQLKKTWGGGSVENGTLYDVATNDRIEIIRQLSIYQPNFIVGCGNGEQLEKVFCSNGSAYNKTSSGVGYWKIELGGRNCFIVDYCHPRSRAGTKVKGIIAKGLASAIKEIEENA